VFSGAVVRELESSSAVRPQTLGSPPVTGAVVSAGDAVGVGGVASSSPLKSPAMRAITAMTAIRPTTAAATMKPRLRKGLGVSVLT